MANATKPSADNSADNSTVRPDYQILRDVKLGTGVKIYGPVNLYECTIGSESKIGAFVEIQRGVEVGERCKISSHSFLCEGVQIEDEVFIGHGVIFTNDTYPRATTESGLSKTDKDWKVERTVIRKRASIGSGAVLLPNIEVGENAIVGAGSVVTASVAAGTVVAGNPARVIRNV